MSSAKAKGRGGTRLWCADMLLEEGHKINWMDPTILKPAYRPPDLSFPNLKRATKMRTKLLSFFFGCAPVGKAENSKIMVGSNGTFSANIPVLDGKNFEQ
ncbi:hypothetical protein CR513_21475, partial [Mucuna pruriens]